MINFVHRVLIQLYIYSSLFWLGAVIARIFFNSPKMTIFFNETVLPTAMTMVVVAMVHWAIAYRKFFKDFPDNYKG